MARPRAFAWIALIAALLLAAAADSARAHGGPEKVIDRRFVVSVALAPAEDATRLRFSLRDFRSGQPLTEAVSYRVRIVPEHAPGARHETPPASFASGRSDVVYRFPGDGFYEVFLEFWLDGEPAQVYRPEDWRIWIGTTAGGIETWLPVGVAGTAALVTAVVGMSRKRRRRDEGV